VSFILTFLYLYLTYVPPVVAPQVEVQIPVVEVQSIETEAGFTDEYPTVTVIADGNVAQEFIDATQEYVDKLPGPFLEKFNELGWSIYVVTWDINQREFNGLYGSVAGVTCTAPKAIYIEDRMNAIDSATVHEFGHFVDYMYSDIDCRHGKADFVAIFNEECANSANAGFTAYDRSSIREWFAELFYRSYFYPEETKEHCPKGYQYMMDLENNL
jgi:hypothetical protein